MAEEIQTLFKPEIAPAFGSGFTVIVAVAAPEPQKADATVYDIVAVPAVTPPTTPVALTLAIPGAVLLHEPPVIASDNVVTAPAQTVVVPVMVPGFGSAFTVIGFVVVAVPQLFVTTYDNVAEPAATPVTTPLASIDAMALLLLPQIPPVIPSVIVVVAATQTDTEPTIVPAVGKAFTVIVVEVAAVPQAVVTV
jgi:hypothetical protein